MKRDVERQFQNDKKFTVLKENRLVEKVKRKNILT